MSVIPNMTLRTRLAACEADKAKAEARVQALEQQLETQRIEKFYEEERTGWETLKQYQKLERENVRLKEALRLVVQVGENVLKPKFDHCGAMNATQLADRDCVLNVLEQAQHALEGG